MGHPIWRGLPALSLAAIVSGALFVPQAHAQFTYTDTSMSYKWGPSYTDPGNDHNFPKQIISFTHADGYKYGENFFNVDVLLSDNTDPTSITTKPGSTPNGSTEIFIVDRHDFSLNAITGTEWFKIPGFIRDLRVEAGGNLNAEDTTFGPNVRAVMFGPSIAFDVPDGFFNLAFDLYKEWNNNGFAGGAFVAEGANFDPTIRVEGAWGVGFHLFGERFKYEGFFDVTPSKGKPFDGGTTTVTEFLIHNKLKYDFGNLIMHKEHVVEGGIGFEYWRNKFGNDASGPNKVPGSEATTPFVFTSVYF